jgi:hypothetical protein
MIVLLGLLGCGAAWTEAGAVAPTLARMDRDRNGSVSSQEYDAVRFRGPPFAEVDADGNKSVSPAELLALVLAKDPLSLSPHRPAAPAPGKQGRGPGAGKGPGGPPGGPGGPPGAPGGASGAAPAADRDSGALRREAASVTRRVLVALKEEIRAVAPNQATPTDEAVKRAGDTADLRTAESRAVLAELETASDAVGIAFPASLRAAALAGEPVVPTVHAEPLRDEKPRVPLGRDGMTLLPGAEDAPAGAATP